MAPLVVPVDVGPHARAAVTGRDRGAPPPPVGAAGNLSHRRPHRPDDLARARAQVGAATGMPPARWHLLHQVHGADVAVVDATTPPGAELAEVDAAVTCEPGRVLAVQAADCVPVLLAGPTAVGVAHAGRRGAVLGVVPATVAALARVGSPPEALHAVLGPAIGGCCYEVPGDLQETVAAQLPDAAATTTWGTPALDLPAAVRCQLRATGVSQVADVGGCTRCDPEGRWFSHRADPATGRQLGLVVRDVGVAA
ncbi:peptidoglycan editing factor PgeF [Nitriliruptor alkaliphilus]|uniref:peptidoglycan editing factor PgeF n=1 Tax=Nitriliruptor alkaliphilus TaxID=427918 RepID=UPI0006969058|nr:peptidoglycan editing factor PgeF [Nitriliruptor alkaliphilus]